MHTKELDPYFSFWNRAFALEQDIQGLEGLHLVSKGPYLARDLSLIYIFKSGAGTLVTAKEETIQKISAGLLPSETTLDQERLNAIIGPTEKLFDDIDHHLPSGSMETWNEANANIRRLSSSDLNLINELYEKCTEDDKDTTEPNIEKDTVWGSFVDGALVSLSSYYIVPNSSIADLTVVTALPFRGQGHAVQTLKPTIREAVLKGFVPRYRARRQNLGTLKVASSLGFAPHCAIQVFTFTE